MKYLMPGSIPLQPIETFPADGETIGLVEFTFGEGDRMFREYEWCIMTRIFDLREEGDCFLSSADNPNMIHNWNFATGWFPIK